MKHILLVDDDMVSLAAASSMLKDGYQVSLAKNGGQALEFCTKEKPDLILLDINMPGLNGFEIIELLKKNQRTCKIPVIFLTANQTASAEAKGFEAGAVDFITKPFVKSSMLHRVNTHLQLYGYQNHLEELVQSLEGSIITSFLDMLECHDDETGEHSQRTTDYVKLLINGLKQKKEYMAVLTDEYIWKLVRSIPLHDIGKIGISDIILQKPGKLDDLEFTIMKQHTLIGNTILTRVMERTPTQNYLEIGREIAVSHHEHFDGTGYPYGLKGDDIPLSGRIMAVADVYDALTSDRMYRPAMTHEEAYRIIKDGRNTHFDPDIADVFLENAREFEKIVMLR